MSQWALVWLPEDSIQREAAHIFINGVKQHLLGSKRLLNKALNQALKLEVAKAVNKSPARLWEIRAEVPMRIQFPVTKSHGTR
jgi:hypothetical protein